MQSALVTNHFLQAMVEAPTTVVEPTDQGFAVAFEQDPRVPDSDVAFADSQAVGPIVPTFWVGPVQTIPASVHAGLHESELIHHLEADIADSGIVPVAPEDSLTSVVFGVSDPGPAQGPDITMGAISEASDVGAILSTMGRINEEAEGLPADRAGRFEPERHRMPGDAVRGSLQTEIHAPDLTLQTESDTEPDVVQRPVRLNSGTQATIPAAIMANWQPEAVQTGASEAGGTIQLDETIEEQIVRREPSQASHDPIGGGVELKEHASQVTFEGDLSIPDLRREVRQPDIGRDVERPASPMLDLHQGEPAEPGIRRASFWEHVFAGLTAPNHATYAPTDQGAVHDPAVGPSVALVAGTPELMSVRVAANVISLPTLSLPRDRSQTAPLDEPSVQGPWPVATGGSAPVPNGLTDSMPLIQVSEWDQSHLEGREHLDHAPLSGQLFQPGFGATSGPHGSLSLPVHQVAMQLAKVMVEVTDKATELALAPEELGRVSLRLEPDAANPDRMTILINVERPETLDLFRRHAGELAEAIKAAGYSGADIGFGQHGQGSNPDHKPTENAPGSGRSAEDPALTSPARRDVVGASLDLRL
jgi:Flagellar hook-length control protein FliK